MGSGVSSPDASIPEINADTVKELVGASWDPAQFDSMKNEEGLISRAQFEEAVASSENVCNMM
jgi:hypothetical protein